MIVFLVTNKSNNVPQKIMTTKGFWQSVVKSEGLNFAEQLKPQVHNKIKFTYFQKHDLIQVEKIEVVEGKGELLQATELENIQ